MNKLPKTLQPDSKICICAPSSHAEPHLIEKAKKILEREGYKIELSNGLFEQYGQIAGTAAHRAKHLEKALLSDEFDAILCAAGGHRSAQIVPLLDWKTLSKARPKIVMGMSDNSALLNAITHKLNWVTVLAPTLHQIAKRDHNYSAPSLSALSGDITPLNLDYDGASIKGRIIACTLSLLPLILANEGLNYFKDSILCVEDVAEEYSTIDRLMLHANLSGLFNEGFVKALVLGDFTSMRDSGRPFGFDIFDIVKEHSNGLPIATNALFGHGNQCHPIFVGSQGTLNKNALSFNV